jgi:uncharacterized protein (DUF697 family)
MPGAGSFWSPSKLLGGTALVASAFSFLQIMRELDLGEIQQQVARRPRVVVTAADLALAQRLADLLQADSSGPPLLVQSLSQQDSGNGTGAWASPPDLALLAVEPGADHAALIAAYRARGMAANVPVVAVGLDHWSWEGRREIEGPAPTLLVATHTGQPDDLVGLLAEAAVDLLPEDSLALGRWLHSLRAPIAELLIRDTSLANAKFALFTNLPAAILPLLGGLVASAADVIVLTKNQGLLVYKLAGLHERDLDDRFALTIEIASVVGAAFFWRTAARTLAGLLPMLVGALPKAAVAYGGTYTIGQLAQVYYRTGQRPSPEVVERLQQQAAELAARVTSALPGREE